MFHIGLDVDQSTENIAQAAANLPVGASLGRLIAITVHGILAEDDQGAPVMWGVDPDDGFTWRVAGLADGRSERTVWFGGNELSRRILRG